jgi:hypothetical protein
VHYIPVRWHDFETDLVKKVQWAVANDAAAKSIMLMGRKFAQEELTDAMVTRYQEEVCCDCCFCTRPVVVPGLNELHVLCRFLVSWHFYKTLPSQNLMDPSNSVVL